MNDTELEAYIEDCIKGWRERAEAAESALAEARKERDYWRGVAEDHAEIGVRETNEAMSAESEASTLRAALRQIKARAQAIPENPIANDIEDIARAALSEQDNTK